MLAVSGRYDPIVPADEALQLVYLLRKGRSGSEWVVGERPSRVDRGNRENCAAVVGKSRAGTPRIEQELAEVILSRDHRGSRGT